MALAGLIIPCYSTCSAARSAGVRWSGNLKGTQRQQVAELVPKLVEVWEYERPLYQCPACGWQGYLGPTARMPRGV